MPTGYTAFIEDGTITTGKDFLMLCARAMDATVSMREEPLTTPIPHRFEPSDFYTKSLEKARKHLEYLRAIKAEDIQKEINKGHKEKLEGEKRYREKQSELRRLYTGILGEVEAWQPPTQEHKALKMFAIEQIEMCLPETRIETGEPKKPSPEKWMVEELHKCLQDIEHYEEKEKEEIQRCERRNKWLKDLRGSLGIEEETHD